ncbi:MAG: vWA domain-containing protein [Thainema sp.]
MRVALRAVLSDANLDAAQANSQRQLAVSMTAIAHSQQHAPLNLCLVLDHSGSMHGRPLDTVKQAAIKLVENLSPHDRISIIGFDHRARVIVENQAVDSPAAIKSAISQLKATGGTCIDEGMKLGIEELIKGKDERVSQVFLLTDGENEHGDNERCLKLANLSASYNITLNTLGFGDHWNQDVLEQIADAAGGALTYIQKPEAAVDEFNKLLTRVQSVALTNAHLYLRLSPDVRLAELKPVAQVAPDTVELPLIQDGDQCMVRIGDLMVDVPRVVLVNLYIGQLAAGTHEIAQVQIRYDDPVLGQQEQTTDTLPVMIQAMTVFQPAPEPEVQTHVLALAKYRQTQIAEQKLKDGDRAGAATMLQSAAKTAIQMGDQSAATVLQENATRLQSGGELSESDRKQTRIVSKTMLQGE